MAVRVRRRLGLVFMLFLLCAGGALAWYVRDQGFTKKWRNLIAEELAQHGLKADIGRLTLDPVDGLTARDVKLYDLTHSEQHLADINRITLDIDLGRLVSRENFLRTVQLQGANVNLPVDPSDDGSERITVRNLDARLSFRGDSIDITQFRGVVAGIRMNVRGSVLKPPPRVSTPDEERKTKEERRKQLREMRDRRGFLRSLLRQLDRFEAPGDGSRYKAELDLEVHGELANLDNASVAAQLHTGPLRCGTFLADSVDAEVKLRGGELALRSLRIKDGHGLLEAAAAWKIHESDEIRFSLSSGIDIEALLNSLPDEPPPWLNVVRFESPPNVRVEGTWFTSRKFSFEKPPCNLLGRFSAGAVVVPGAEDTPDTKYDGVSTDFSLRPDGSVYLRNAEITRAGGQSVTGAALWNQDGLRYHFAWRMSLDALTPVLKDEKILRALREVEFGPESLIEISGSGTCGRNEPRVLRHKGKVDLRNFSARGVPVRQFVSDIEMVLGPTPGLTFTNFALLRPEGQLRGRTVAYDLKGGLIGVSEVFCNADHTAIVSMFHRKLAATLSNYRFTKPAELSVNGAIDTKGPERTALKIVLKSEGRAGMNIGKDPWEFDSVRGTIGFTDNVLETHLTGMTVPDSVAAATLRLTEPAEARIDGTFGLSKAKADATDYVVRIDRPVPALLHLMGKSWPVYNMQAVLRNNGRAMAIKAAASLFGGPVAADLTWDDLSTGVHSGTMTLKNAAFRGFADRFGAGRSSEGRLSGEFSWTASAGPRGLTGSGRLELNNGNIFALPLLGPLSTIVDALVPGKELTYSVARNATSTLRIERGVVTVPDFKALTPLFELTADGGIDYVANRVDMDATLNFRGIISVPFTLVSKLMEYNADGTTDEPNWHLKVLSNPFKKKTPLGEDPKPVRPAR